MQISGSGFEGKYEGYKNKQRNMGRERDREIDSMHSL